MGTQYRLGSLAVTSSVAQTVLPDGFQQGSVISADCFGCDLNSWDPEQTIHLNKSSEYGSNQGKHKLMRGKVGLFLVDFQFEILIHIVYHT